MGLPRRARPEDLPADARADALHPLGPRPVLAHDPCGDLRPAALRLALARHRGPERPAAVGPDPLAARVEPDATDLAGAGAHHAQAQPAVAQPADPQAQTTVAALAGAR